MSVITLVLNGFSSCIEVVNVRVHDFHEVPGDNFSINSYICVFLARFLALLLDFRLIAFLLLFEEDAVEGGPYPFSFWVALGSLFCPSCGFGGDASIINKKTVASGV